MLCDCGYTAFRCLKFQDNKRFNVYKCGHIETEKNKNKCDMNITEYISDILSSDPTDNLANSKEYTSLTSEEEYKKNLNKFIYLCEITSDFPRHYRKNYLSNINFLLKKLNFRLYFEDHETLDNLKKRITHNFIPKTKTPSIYPIKLIYYPEYLSVERSKIKKPDIKLSEFAPLYTIRKERKSSRSETNDSDSGSNEEDNAFDMENNDSDNCSFFSGDGGSFSD